MWAAWAESKGDQTASDLHKMMATLGATSELYATAGEDVAHAQTWVTSYQAAREATDAAQDTGTEPSQPWSSSFFNPEECPLKMSVSGRTAQNAAGDEEYRFTIPPRSTYYLCDCTHADAFRASFREITDEYALPRHFDLVLLDPPWPNRSAKRKGAYEQVGGMPNMRRMLMQLDLDSYLEHNALVGIWITNKESLREHEWVWIKTTTKGDPILDMDGVRRPYEILLLGRAAPNVWNPITHATTVKRRVIAAVPDIHSRKPCLKELLQPYMPDPVRYSALEVFARSLVSGWASWGNEVLKYNCDDYWVSGTGHEHAPLEYSLPIRTG
ncbi:MT-A70-domain-containing protein [Phaeosphaeriaceae sp. PMI808]|nr:MT-A70-domain-containing protein [Phaeosphaeriaceae sp. PMI808]